MKAIFKKEINRFFSSPSGTLIIVIFLLINSSLLWWISGTGQNILEAGYSNIDPLFFIAPFLLILFIPAICMNSFSAEIENGTIETLKTKPITNLQIILGKYFAIITIVSLSILPTFTYLFSVYYLSENGIDLGGITGSYIGLFLLSFVFASISLFCSSLSRNPLSALIISIIMCSLFYFGFDIISNIDTLETFKIEISKLGIASHYKTLSKGLLALTDVLYFLIITMLFLQFTNLNLNKKND